MTTAEFRSNTGDMAEAAVVKALRSAGFEVTNLNDLSRNFPVGDLMATRGGQRLVLQVRGRRDPGDRFTAEPHKARALEALGKTLGAHALYGFAVVGGSEPTIRFATAREVAVLAEEDEANYPKKNRYHVNISQFDVGVDAIGSLLPTLEK